MQIVSVSIYSYTVCTGGVIIDLISPLITNFWGVYRRFLAKYAKYWSIHIIKTAS